MIQSLIIQENLHLERRIAILEIIAAPVSEINVSHTQMAAAATKPTVYPLSCATVADHQLINSTGKNSRYFTRERLIKGVIVVGRSLWKLIRRSVIILTFFEHRNYPQIVSMGACSICTIN